MTREQYQRTTFNGEPVTRRQKQALQHVEKKVGRPLIAIQGSWQPRTPWSSTTHMGAGVIDLWVAGADTNDELRRHVTRLLRDEGRQAAFSRGPLDKMPWHWHVVDLDTTHMDPLAIFQTQDYRAGNNGLGAGGTPDRYPYRPDPIRKWLYQPGVR